MSVDARNGLSLPRAGFWRRAIAWIIDALLTLLITSIIIGVPVSWLFAVTNGSVQFGLLNIGKCAPPALSILPGNLDPPPLRGWNFAVDCRSYLLGLTETARVLTVGKVSTVNHGNYRTTTSISTSYGLGADGLPRKVVSLDWLGWLFLLVYLVFLQSRYGATAGMALLRIRVMNVEFPGSVGISAVKALIRVLVFFAGFIPVLAYLVWLSLSLRAASNDSQEVAASNLMPILLTAAVLISGVFYVWILIVIVLRRDPVYDRIAKTAVVLTALVSPAPEIRTG
jgi:hypothetical protein